MSVRLERVQAIARFYEDEGTADARGPYIGIANVLWLSKTHVLILGMHGHVSRRDLRELLVSLQKLGVTHVEAERRGKHVVYSLEDLYELRHPEE